MQRRGFRSVVSDVISCPHFPVGISFTLLPLGTLCAMVVQRWERTARLLRSPVIDVPIAYTLMRFDHLLHPVRLLGLLELALPR